MMIELEFTQSSVHVNFFKRLPLPFHLLVLTLQWSLPLWIFTWHPRSEFPWKRKSIDRKSVV